MSNNLKFAFFGGEPLSLPTLDKLYRDGLVPSLIVSNSDRPQGRYLEITPPPAAIWAKEHNIPLLQSEKLNREDFDKDFDFFVVVSYGKIIPKEILELPKLGTINIHPSLLPAYRGPSPIVSAILNGDAETGITIIKIDEELDHGPILAQEKIKLSLNELAQDLEKILAELGGEMLVKVIPLFIDNKLSPREQDHSQATFTKKIKKEDGLIDLNDDGIKNYNKFRAYATWPRTFFFKDGKRIIITKAKLENGNFVIEKILPEGKKEIPYNPL